MTVITVVAVKAVTGNRIGFKAAFIKDKNGEAIQVPENFHEDGYKLKRWEGQEVLGPIPNVLIEGGIFNKAASGSDGFYGLYWFSIPCPMVFYSIDSHVIATLQYKRFNPKAKGRDGIYFIMKPMVENLFAANLYRAIYWASAYRSWRI